MEEYEDVSSMVDDLILQGALEVSAIDMESGEILYNFTEKLKDVSPELYTQYISEINGAIMTLWQGGFVEIDLANIDGMAIYLTEKAFDDEEIAKLPKDYKHTLSEIKRIILEM